MTLEKDTRQPLYTCNEYRQEMILLALRNRLRQPDVTDAEKSRLTCEIARLEKEIGL